MRIIQTISETLPRISSRYTWRASGPSERQHDFIVFSWFWPDGIRLAVLVANLSLREALMKHSRLLISGSILLAAWMNGGISLAQTSGKSSETIHPDLNESKGGSKSERNQSGTPLPKNDPSTGTVEKGTSRSSDMTTPRSSDTTTRKSSSGTSKNSASDTTKGKDTDQSNKTEPLSPR